MHYFDTYPLQSRLRKVHPDVKMSLFAVYTAIALASQSVIISAALVVLVFSAILYTARIGFFRLVRLMLVPGGFVFLGSVSVMVEFDPALPILSMATGAHRIGITPAGLHGGIFLFARSFSAVAVLYALVLNTTITDILFVLRKLKAPETLLDIMVLVYRNIFIFSDTANSIYTSQKSRLGYRSLRTSIRSTGQLGGRMFVLAGVRTEYLYRSMESRCYNGNIHTLPDQWTANPVFTTMAGMVAAVFATALYYF
jgi:cobalt/nickel transport system permease protein